MATHDRAHPNWIWLSLFGLASLSALGFGGDDQQVDAKIEADGVARSTSEGDMRKADPGPAPSRSADTHGGVLAGDRHGLLVVERSAGRLVRADHSGKHRASLSLTPGLGELVLDRAGHAYVADRSDDRIVRVDVDEPEQLRELASVAVPEPHGLALTPDGTTLLVTSISEHALVALDAKTLAPSWEVELAPEPRAVAVSPDGSQAVVGFLSSGSLALVDLTSEGKRVRWSSLEPRDHVETEREEYDGCEDMFTMVTKITEARSRFSVPVETGRRYARNLYALAYASDGALFAPHQRATPQLQRVVASEASDSYGGQSAETKPIAHELARVVGVDGFEITTDFVELRVHQPRALAYDPGEDRLYVAGYGDDRIVAVERASTPAAAIDWSTKLELPDRQACGIDGLTLDDAESRGLWVHCEFGRKLARLDLDTRTSQVNEQWLTGEVLAESARPAKVEQGAELFRRSDWRISDGGDLACSNCHPEGRSDGLTWRLGKSILQAPMLVGRMIGSGPYKWDGQDPTLHDSLRHTMSRLGGSPERVTDAEFDAMVAFLESLPPPKPPDNDDPKAIARGREVFEAAACDACHEGDLLTDGNQHELDTTLDHVDTPSLIGIAHSRPYFHDGSAPDLWTLLTDRGTVHDMADTSDLSDEQLRDLVAYLESL